MASLTIYLDNHRLTDREVFPLAITQQKPLIHLKQENDKYYTIIMSDPDAPSKDNPIYHDYLHWLIINNNQTIVPFQAPDPPTGSNQHRYFFTLWEQLDGTIKVKIPQRPNFSPETFAQKYHLKKISSIHFLTERTSAQY